MTKRPRFIADIMVKALVDPLPKLPHCDYDWRDVHDTIG